MEALTAPLDSSLCGHTEELDFISGNQVTTVFYQKQKPPPVGGEPGLQLPLLEMSILLSTPSVTISHNHSTSSSLIYPVTCHKISSLIYPVTCHKISSLIYPVTSHKISSLIYPVTCHKTFSLIYPVTCHKTSSLIYPVTSHKTSSLIHM